MKARETVTERRARKAEGEAARGGRYRPEHAPHGDPCKVCGLARSKHRNRKRPEHDSIGDPCADCGLEEAEHRGARGEREPPVYTYIGLDGEGQGRADHRYMLLAASDESGGLAAHVEAPEGGRLSTRECLDFLLTLPSRRTRIFSYAFGYDLTKILTDLDNESLYLLFRPELRGRSKKWAHLGPRPVLWPHAKKGPYSLKRIRPSHVQQNDARHGLSILHARK